MSECSFNPHLCHCSSKIWRQHGCRWKPSCLFDSGWAEEQRALTFNLYVVTWPRGRRRINNIYKNLTRSFLLHQLASSKHQKQARLIHRNIQQEVCLFIIRITTIIIIGYLLFSLSKHFIQKVLSLQRQREILDHRKIIKTTKVPF